MVGVRKREKRTGAGSAKIMPQGHGRPVSAGESLFLFLCNSLEPEVSDTARDTQKVSSVDAFGAKSIVEYLPVYLQ